MDEGLFVRQVAAVDRRLTELLAGVDGVRLAERSATSATWERGSRRATLVRHADPARYQVEFLGAPGDPPEAEEIGVDDPDVVELLAQPIAGFLRG